MQRIFRLLIPIYFLLATPLLTFGQWIENYYECLCSGNSQESCNGQIEEGNPEFQKFAFQFANHPQNARESLTQIRSAQIILDQRMQIRFEEEGECLQHPFYIIKQAAFFAGRENTSATPISAIRISALRELSKEVYHWAEKNCFNQVSAPSKTISSNLPNASLCKAK